MCISFFWNLTQNPEDISSWRLMDFITQRSFKEIFVELNEKKSLPELGFFLFLLCMEFSTNPHFQRQASLIWGFQQFLICLLWEVHREVKCQTLQSKDEDIQSLGVLFIYFVFFPTWALNIMVEISSFHFWNPWVRTDYQSNWIHTHALPPHSFRKAKPQIIFALFRFALTPQISKKIYRPAS